MKHETFGTVPSPVVGRDRVGGQTTGRQSKGEAGSVAPGEELSLLRQALTEQADKRTDDDEQ